MDIIELEYNPWKDYIPLKSIDISNKSTEENVKPQVKAEGNLAVYSIQAVIISGQTSMNVKPFDDCQQQMLQKLVTSFSDICTKSQVEIEYIKFLELTMNYFALKWLWNRGKFKKRRPCKSQ
jgi:hypothetical protein